MVNKGSITPPGFLSLRRPTPRAASISHVSSSNIAVKAFVAATCPD
jgi:hypothetical protein